MKTLQIALLKHLPSPVTDLGPKRPLKKDQLRSDLLDVSEKNKSFFYIGTGMIVVLFIAALVLVWMWHERAELVTGIFAATGVSITGLIVTMFSHWKEKVKSDMLLALLAGAPDEETLKNVIGILANRLGDQ